MPTKDLYKEALNVLTYLHYNKDLGLRYEPEETNVTAMSDSDRSVRRSTSGSIIQWHKACIDWGTLNNLQFLSLPVKQT